MKRLKYFLVTALFYCATLHAQVPAEEALKCADSMLKVYQSENLNAYLDFCYPGVVQYYGGTKNFLEFVQRNKAIEQPAIQPDKLQLVQIESEAKEWQCVIQRTHETVIGGKNAAIVSYMIGQSPDHGNTWRFVDVALNSTANITYIMPDIFASLTIPSREVVFSAVPPAEPQSYKSPSNNCVN